MPYPRHSINAPALLRALADVMKTHPHSCPDLNLSYLLDEPPLFADVSFSARIMIGHSQFNLAMGAAYKRHGGDPADLGLEAADA